MRRDAGQVGILEQLRPLSGEASERGTVLPAGEDIVGGLFLFAATSRYSRTGGPIGRTDASSLLSARRKQLPSISTSPERKPMTSLRRQPVRAITRIISAVVSYCPSSTAFRRISPSVRYSCSLGKTPSGPPVCAYQCSLPNPANGHPWHISDLFLFA